MAKVLVGYSCSVKPGENVMIQATGADSQIVASIVREVYAAGGRPFVNIGDPRISREILSVMTPESAKFAAECEMYRMRKIQCYIAIRGGENSFELSDVPAEKINLFNQIMMPVQNYRVQNTKWVILRYPTQGMAQQAGMSTTAFENLYFDVCTLDYAKMDRAMNPLVSLMRKTDKVRISAEGTDLTFSIKDIGVVKCSGERNIPDGEIYTAPVKTSVNGFITYNAPSIRHGIKFENVRLVFRKGKIIEATANNTEKLNEFLDIDAGARYIGEFAMGVNPHIKKPMGDILFDEKISGSIHFTPGKCYKETDNGNKSAEHWDLVQIHTPEYGGGEIWFDDVLIRKNGRFVLPELEGLNPENLI